MTQRFFLKIENDDYPTRLKRYIIMREVTNNYDQKLTATYPMAIAETREAADDIIWALTTTLGI